MEIIIMVAALVIYFLPAIISNRKRNGNLICALTLFLGWTGIVWIGLFIWACVAQSNEDYELNQKALRKMANS